MNQKMNKGGDEGEVQLDFGLGGITWGPESRGSCCDWHIRYINLRAKMYFTNSTNGEIIPGVSICYQIAGHYEPDLRDETGPVKFSVKYKEADIDLYLSLASFLPGNEENFRNILAGLIDEAVEKVVKHKRSPKVGIDVEILERQWAKLRADYMAVELPMAEPKPENFEPIVVPPSTEYYFLFDKKKNVKAFEKAIAHFGLSVDWDDESDDGYYVVLQKMGDMGVEKDLEAELIAHAEKFGGNYDGWSA